MEFNHKPVLFSETIQSLNIQPDKIYVDCTAGGGGHSSAIAEKLTTGKLIAIDQDPEAIEVLQERLGKNPNVIIVHDNFFNLDNILKNLNITSVGGVLADLGVSSHQLDTAERGFSFHSDAYLDMRMSKEGTSAADLVNTLPYNELCRIISQYGEEKYAASIAKNIVKEREKENISTTLQLAEIIKNSVPMKARRDGHPARKTFQALRIAVNGELDILEQSIDKMFNALSVGGVLSIISFHSIEDRIIKQKYNSYCEKCSCPPEFPVCVCGKSPRGRLLFKFKAAGQEELEDNNRSRSAKLRAIEKIKED